MWLKDKCVQILLWVARVCFHCGWDAQCVCDAGIIVRGNRHVGDFMKVCFVLIRKVKTRRRLKCKKVSFSPEATITRVTLSFETG